MIRKHVTVINLGAILFLALYSALVIVHEYQGRKKAHDRIAVHADMVSYPLWNYNEKGASLYLFLAAELEHYASVRVMDTRGNVFQKLSGEPPGLDRFFSAIGFYHLHPLAAPIRYNGRIIGTLQAERVCKSIYFDVMLLLAFVMVFMIVQLYTGLMDEKKMLENRVADRTRALLKVNESLKHEISQHKFARQALEVSEERYRAYFEENIAGTYISKPSGRLIDCNQQYLDIFGFRNKEEALYTSLKDIYIHRDERRRFLDALVEKKKVSAYETTFRKIDGTRIHLIENAAAVFDENGRLDHIRGFLLDVTEKHRLEMQLMQSQKMESIGRLAGGVAHDFNNMLNVILGHVDLALDKIDASGPLHNHLQQIRDAAGHSTDITRQLLAFARKQPISPRLLDLNETVEGTLKMLRRLIGEDIDLVWKPADHPGTVKMDPSQIHQILANLCVNARDAIRGEGRITIETRKKRFYEQEDSDFPDVVPGEFMMLRVSDDGCGMDQHTLDNLFDPFFTTKEVGKGTGLGLSTVYGIVKQNKGFIHVTSRLNEGSSFDIFLPGYQDAASPHAGDSPGKVPAGKGETVLVVEDETSILELLQTMLEQLGYTVLAESSPRAALDRVKHRSGRIDMLITDVIMPEMNGRVLAGRIRELYPEIRLLFMSGYPADVIAEQGVLNQGVQFIQKPFSMQDIAEKVHAALR